MLDQLFQAMGFAKTVTAHSKQWQVVHQLPNGYALAIPLGEQLPAITYVIKLESK